MENSMSIKEAVIAFWTKAFDFSGRARRREVWLNILANVLIAFFMAVVVLIIELVTGSRFHLLDHFNFFINTIAPYILIIPGMAQASRRLQDINLDGRIAIVITVAMTIIEFLMNHMTAILPLNIQGPTWITIVLGLLVGGAGLFLFVINFIRGNEGDNKYGEDPKRMG